jgi:nitrile hydratase
MTHASLADLGGQLGHGRVQPEPEPGPQGVVFHAAWEPRVLALTLAMGASGAWNIDMSRAARETLPDYARLSYYEIWLAGLQRLLAERGLVAADEVARELARESTRERPRTQTLHPAPPLPRKLMAADVPAVLARGSATERPATRAARFAAGDAVQLRAGAAPHHTRLPGYARGKVGVVEALRGVHVFADAHGQGLGEQPHWLYTIVFDERELWGDDVPPQGLKVSIDAWEPYLELVEPAP